MHFYFIYGIIFHEKSLVIVLKCLLDYKIINNDEEIIRSNVESEYKNNELSFKDEIDSIKLSINKDNIIMIKDNIDSKFTFNFIKDKKTTLEYYIKMFNSYLDGNILTNTLIIKDNYILIEYELWIQDEHMGNFKFEINIKEI